MCCISKINICSCICMFLHLYYSPFVIFSFGCLQNWMCVAVAWERMRSTNTLHTFTFLQSSLLEESTFDIVLLFAVLKFWGQAYLKIPHFCPSRISWSTLCCCHIIVTLVITVVFELFVVVCLGLHGPGYSLLVTIYGIWSFCHGNSSP